MTDNVIPFKVTERIFLKRLSQSMAKEYRLLIWITQGLQFPIPIWISTDEALREMFEMGLVEF